MLYLDFGFLQPRIPRFPTLKTFTDSHVSITMDGQRKSLLSAQDGLHIRRLTRRSSFSPPRSSRARRRSITLISNSPERSPSLSPELSPTIVETPTPIEPLVAVKQTPTFKYEPLDASKHEIRLLQLSSSNSRWGKALKIVGHLLTVPLDQAPPFECLSYTWAGPGIDVKSTSALADQTISINSCVAKIKVNLHQALARLMHPDTIRILWADALCIDQNNHVELGDQVAKMGAIYTAASQVIVWLGEPSEPACLAFSLLDDLWRNVHDDEAIRIILRSLDTIPALNSLTELFARDYWSRVWVIQEVHFARKITAQCGEYSMPWNQMIAVQNALIDRFLDTLDEARQPIWAPPEFSKHLWHLRHVVEFRGPKSLLFDRSESAAISRQINLFEGLMMHRLKKATDPRDKIYAMVGLTTAARDSQFVIDYKIPAEQVFINTVDYLLRKYESLDIILIHTRSPTHLSLPTWVPDFGSLGSSSAVPFRHALLNSAYASSATKKAEAVIECGKGILSARGICMAFIRTLAPSLETDGLQTTDSLMVGTALIRLWQHFVLNFDDQKLDRLAEFARVLLCDIPESIAAVGSNAAHHSLDILSLFEEDLWLDDVRTDQLNSNIVQKRQRDIAEALAIIKNIFMRSLFITDTGALGMAQDSILEGDLICILFGCSIPVILRRVDGHFIYISDACVVGYMYGKAIEELEVGKLEAELFEIH
jgi:hypothetical protein